MLFELTSLTTQSWLMSSSLLKSSDGSGTTEGTLTDLSIGERVSISWSIKWTMIHSIFAPGYVVGVDQVHSLGSAFSIKLEHLLNWSNPIVFIRVRSYAFHNFQVIVIITFCGRAKRAMSQFNFRCCTINSHVDPIKPGSFRNKFPSFHHTRLKKY